MTKNDESIGILTLSGENHTLHSGKPGFDPFGPNLENRSVIPMGKTGKGKTERDGLYRQMNGCLHHKVAA